MAKKKPAASIKTVTKKAPKAIKKPVKKPATKEAPKKISRYLYRIPKNIPEGLTLCHNQVQHDKTFTPNKNGFRVWVTNEVPPTFKPCSCGWSGLPHFAFKGVK